MVKQASKVVKVFGNDISTDVIYPGRFMATVLPSETPQYAFADEVELNSRFKKKEIPPGSVIVAGTNFGCGSSREQAVSTLKGYELLIIAKGFARIFLQNAINLGLRTVICPTIEVSEGDELDILGDRIINKRSGSACPVVPLPKARQAIVDAGGLIPYTRKRLLEQKSVH
ncbi:MAG TPA: 3-isopropylmalate dehydratase [Bacteroidota bacterium]|nr:3-isopropylmalate dehydratase [Bacteroidota bacterium]